LRTTSIGEVRDDGSILLYDKNISNREGMPRRINPSAAQKQKLAEWDLQWVSSSFISAIGKDEKDLFIRFWNGSYYQYYGFASYFDKMLQANSKGRYFIRNIRKTKQYAKIGSLPLPNDLTIDDTELFKQIAQEMNNIVKMMYLKGTKEVIFDDKTQKEFMKITYGGETIFLSINNVS
jgi:hypothetical protein